MQLNNPIFINQTDADIRYVNTAGDNMTGPLGLNDNNLFAYSAQLINETTNFIISGNDNGRIIIANSSTQITGTIVSGNTTGFNTSIIQIGAGQIQITGAGIGIRIGSYNNQYKTAGQFATASILHTGSNGYIMYGNTTL
jgi:hypothetical protein